MSADISIPFDTIKSITNDFCDKQKIGNGGYGDVYKANYEGRDIAVKRLNRLRASDKEFENELLNIRRFKHRNVVTFIGFSRVLLETKLGQPRGQQTFDEKWERILCFEYMPGGALDKHIKDDYCDLDWPTCYKIIKGTCNGISHLHNKRPKERILHLDLKPANILLDNKNNAKIADFGLSRMAKQTLVAKNVKGTLGYMPPEYINSQHISDKYDVFSLGVLILNVLDGNEVLRRYDETKAAACDDVTKAAALFVDIVCEKWNERWLKEKPGHPSHKIESLQVKKCVALALKCIQEDRHKRPTTKEIVAQLDQFDEEINKLSRLSDDDDRIVKGLDALDLNSLKGHLSQIPSADQLLVNPVTGPGELDVVIVYAFDCSDWSSAWYAVDKEIFWIVQEKLAHYEKSCLGYIYPMMKDNTYKSDMKIVDSEETDSQTYTGFAKRWEYCTKNMACGLDEAQKMIRNRGYQNGIILLFSDGFKHKGDFFDGAEEFESKVPVHTFTLGGDEFDEGLRAIAVNSSGGKFHTSPFPDRPKLSDHFSLLLDNIFDRRTTIEDEKSPTLSSETQPLDVVLVYAFDCSVSSLDWKRMDGTIFWMVHKKLTQKEDSCLGYIYPMSSKNYYTSDMKLVDPEDTGFKRFAWRRLTYTKNMASGLAEANKMVKSRGYQNGIILFFSDGLINKQGDFYDGTDNFKSEVPVHTFTLGGDAYNEGLEAIAKNSQGGEFHCDPVPDRPELSESFSNLLDRILGTKTD